MKRFKKQTNYICIKYFIGISQIRNAGSFMESQLFFSMNTLFNLPFLFLRSCLCIFLEVNYDHRLIHNTMNLYIIHLDKLSHRGYGYSAIYDMVRVPSNSVPSKRVGDIHGITKR